MSRYTSMRALMLGALLAVIGTAASAARVPNTTPVVTDSVTDEELYVTAVWENGPLYSGLESVATLHYPIESKAADCTSRGCTNGCTIGYGYNFGAHTREKVYDDLTAAGIPAETARKFQRYAGVTGTAAVRMCGDNYRTGTEPTLTREQSWELMRLLLEEHKVNVVQRATDEGVINDLNSGQFAILVALDYQNPTLCSQATDIWQHLRDGRNDRVATEIRDRSGTRFAPQLQRRRNWEADYWTWATNLGRYLDVQDAMLYQLSDLPDKPQ